MPSIFQEVEELIGKLKPPLFLTFVVEKSNKERLLSGLERLQIKNLNVHLDEPLESKNHKLRWQYLNLKSKKEDSIEIYIHELPTCSNLEDTILYLRENNDGCLEAVSSLIIYINDKIEIIKNRMRTEF